MTLFQASSWPDAIGNTMVEEVVETENTDIQDGDQTRYQKIAKRIREALQERGLTK
jgi:hypothetical protein